MNWDKLFRYLINQGQQSSTWRGVILVATALGGFSVSEEKAAAVALIGLSVAGAMGMIFPDNLKKPDDKEPSP